MISLANLIKAYAVIIPAIGLAVCIYTGLTYQYRPPKRKIEKVKFLLQSAAWCWAIALMSIVIWLWMLPAVSE